MKQCFYNGYDYPTGCKYKNATAKTYIFPKGTTVILCDDCLRYFKGSQVKEVKEMIDFMKIP